MKQHQDKLRALYRTALSRAADMPKPGTTSQLFNRTTAFAPSMIVPTYLELHVRFGVSSPREDDI
jgi:hypothetical protein